MSAAPVRITGGCQCGAIRYALHARPTGASICHCRMCQKAFGSYFAPLAGVPLSDFEVTRGEIAYFRSSDEVERGFCRDCGTPLIFHAIGSEKRISVSLGSLDDPASIQPELQYGIESRMPWFAGLPRLPGDKTTEEDDPPMAASIAASNHQHPDHDTSVWPPPHRSAS
jgi:hypothetical protein